MTDKYPAKIDVNLDGENAGKSRRKGDIHTVYIKPTKKLRFDTLHAYMAGTTNNWTVDCLEAINFLDHLLREKPSQRYVTVKRSFFKPTPESRFSLGEGVDAAQVDGDQSVAGGAGPGLGGQELGHDVGDAGPGGSAGPAQQGVAVAFAVGAGEAEPGGGECRRADCRAT